MVAQDGPLLRDVSEEQVLAEILPAFAATGLEVVGPGDDAAVLAAPHGTLVATTDSMVRGRDWLDEWSTPEDVAVKCLTQNLSDVAAMGARPTAVLVSLAADPATPLEWVRRFAAELGRVAASVGVSVAGGDLSSAPAGTLLVAVTALGDLVGDPVRRDGARPGDVVAVRGTLGRSGAGLRLLRAGRGSEPAAADLVRVHVAPPGAYGDGVVAASAGATAMIDLSDGLLRDLDRVARASGVLADLSAAALGADHDVLAPLVGAQDAWEDVLAGGEEHSLLATFPAPADVPRGWRVIGTVRPTAGEPPGVALDGVRQEPRGWDHFAG